MNASVKTAKAPKTVEFFKAKQEKLRAAHNKRCEAARKGEINWKESLRQHYATVAETCILLREAEEAGFGKHILDTTITFQSLRDYPDGNHGLGDALEKKFPMGKDDSESGQGFFYISQDFEFLVKTWLEKKTEPGSVRVTRSRDEFTRIK